MKQLSALLGSKINCCRNYGLAIVLTLMACICASHAQTNFGQISGTVTDTNGAVVANATVSVIDSETNIKKTVTTNESGFFNVTNLQAATYTVTVEVANFKKSVQPGNVLTADGKLTVDFSLTAGQISEVVEVTPTSGETVNTTSGEVGKVIDSQQVDNLALNGRNYYQLLSVVPGAVVTADDSLDTNLATNTININGNRGVSNNLTIDGGNNNNAGSNASQINNTGIDFIQEVKLETSNFSAEYGRNSGAQINVITKRGGNNYHGTLFEFLRNDMFDSRDAFAAAKPFLRYHDYGFSIGGPLPTPHFGEGGPMFNSGKDKLFFFAGMEFKKIHRFASSSTQTLPTTRELNGDFSFRLRGADGVVGTADDGLLKDPTIVGGVCTAANRSGCFTGNIIPANRITTDGRAIANVYRTMIGLASGYNDTPTGSNATFQPVNSQDFHQEILRIDYLLNNKNTIYGRYLGDDNVVVEPYGTFINSPLPTAQELRNRPGNGLQIGWLWNAKSTLVNELKYNASWTDQRVVPSTPYSQRDTYGFAFNQIYPTGGLYNDSIPNVAVTGFASFSGVAASLTALARDHVIADTLTWVKGNHTFKFGGNWNFSQIFQNGRSLYDGNVAFNNAQNPNTTGSPLADALLGNYRTYSEFSLDPSSHFRFVQYEAFAMDSWRVNRKLSLELGVRWQYGTPFYAAENTITNFDPAAYDPSKAVTLTNSGANVVVGPGQNRFNGLVRPEGDIDPLFANNANVLAVPGTAPRGLYKPKNYFMPRVGFAYSPWDDGKTSIRGGFGMYYDRIEGNIIFALENNPPYVDSGSFENGNISNITGGNASALTPFSNLTTIDPNMKTSYTMNFSLGVQRELPWGVFVEANGVGNLGRNLTRQIDLNSAPLGLQLANPGVNTNLLRPYKGYSGILDRVSDATSHYYAMQLYAAKRKGSLLATVSYTWSKVLTDANVLTEQAEEGLNNREFNYGPASFDRTHILVATYTYAEPFFRKSNSWVRAFLAGYEISGITRFQSGKPYTITGAAAIGGTRRADLITGVDLYIMDNRQWLNPAAFAAAPGARLGSSGVSIVRGPWLETNDFSIRKRFRIGERKDIRLQGDIFNAFNHNNFSNIQTVITNAGFGKFTTSGPGRSLQLGIKFGF